MHDDVEQVAMPARYGELVAAGAALASWLGILVFNGPRLALQTIWMLLIGLGLGAWTITIRLRFSRSRVHCCSMRRPPAGLASMNGLAKSSNTPAKTLSPDPRVFLVSDRGGSALSRQGSAAD